MLLVAVYALPIYICLAFRFQSQHYRLLMGFHRWVCRILNIKVYASGEPSAHRPLMWVSNHFSYLDIHVLGSLLPVCFTPKSDLAGWPVIGWFARMSGCVFIDRRKTKTKANQEQLIVKMRDGHAISLFPEGTTNNGLQLLPFRSSYFSIADAFTGDSTLMIQPISIRYTHLEGEPLTPEQYPLVGWYGDMDFAPHFWQVLRMRGIGVSVLFHPLLNPSEYRDRKQLAANSQELVEIGYKQLGSDFSNAHSGRYTPH